MSLEQQIDADLKKAMLAGQAEAVSTLRGLKSSLLYAKVAAGTRGEEMPDEEVQKIFAKESKKRQESADLYSQGGNEAKATAELTEKQLIDSYLPKQLSHDELTELVKQAMAEVHASSPGQLGVVIGKVRQTAGPTADGGTIAAIAKELLR